MTIILLGYKGLIGSYVLEELAKQLQRGYNLDIICVGRDIRVQPIKNKKIKYIRWNFVDFTKSKLFFLKKKNIIINCIGKNQGNSEDLKKTNLILIQKLCRYILEKNISVRLIHLGSVSVYGAEKKYLNKIQNITENTPTNPDDSYSKSKLEADLFIERNVKLNRKKFSYTILRIANVFTESKNSNSFKLIKNLLKKGIWFKCSKYTNYHFIHAKDVAQVVFLAIKNLKKTANNTYIVSDEGNQFSLHKMFTNFYKRRLFLIPISLKFIYLTIKFLTLPKLILNFFLVISSQTNYDNYKIKKDLNFRPKYSLRKKIL
jgi:nucleoside-diphosphate-sugar epimerase